MTETRIPKEPEILNARYANATPQMVAHALVQHGVKNNRGMLNLCQKWRMTPFN